MFRDLRIRLSLWFVGLTALVFAVLSGLAFFHVYVDMTDALNDELKALASEIRPAIETTGELYSLPEWAENKNGAHQLPACIQLFDRNGTLLHAYGPPASLKLFHGQGEYRVHGQTWAYYCRDLHKDGRVVGHLQVQLPTLVRFRALRQIARTMIVIAPLLLLALGAAGYFFAGLAMRPVESSFAVLRRFMTDAGHELSTPVSVIQVNSDQLEFELSNNHTALERLAVIGRATEKLGALVKDLSFLAKMESPHLSVGLADVRIDKCLQDLLAEFAEPYKLAGVQLLKGDIQALTVVGNQESLQRLFSNLLQNALNYSQAGGSVTVAAVENGGLVRISITDTGIGIPAESLPKIFDRFYRVQADTARPGTGLGLSIVKAIAVNHQGQVEAHSELGRGSKFVVSLPLKR